MGLSLCGSGAWNSVLTWASGASGVSRTQNVKVTGKAKCPKCNHEFDAELTVEQKVQGGVTDFSVKPTSGLTELCPWKM